MTAVPTTPIPPPVRRLIEVVAGRPLGLTIDQLGQALKEQVTLFDVRRLRALVNQALARGLLVQEGDVLRAPAFGTEPVERAIELGVGLGLRAVALDLESVVRTTATDPYTEARIYQIGAVRLGTDSAWIGAEPTLERFVELPDDAWEIRSTHARARHAARKVPPADALLALERYCQGADLVVAYNGTALDFPLLAEAYEREELPVLAPVKVDGYYLALALWPTASSHRLADLADELGIAHEDLTWHDALADARLLDRVLHAAAQALAAWDPALCDLIAAVCSDSPGWTLLRHLAAPVGSVEPLGTSHPWAQGDVAALLGSSLASHQPRRHPPGGLVRPALAVPASVRGNDGRVEATLLATVCLGAAAAYPRLAQQQMTTALHNWVSAATPAMVEAPTGTGKSYAILAAALDWLAGSPTRTAVIATYTKALQGQLARDVAALGAAIPGLLETSDLVKGQANRLSLRALTAAMAEATDTDRDRAGRFLTNATFREFLAFVTSRLIASAAVTNGWIARSVDQVDVPAFFTQYVGPVLTVWLESLSQGSNGEYAAAVLAPVAAYTDVVQEALASHRLILTNHALLLAHRDDLAHLGNEVLLVVDEAHQLEDAATSALTIQVDYRAVENLYGDLGAWLAVAQSGPERASAAAAVERLGKFLELEQLPRLAAQAIDARSLGGGAAVGARVVTLASAYTGSTGATQVRTLAAFLVRLSGQCQALVGALGAYQVAHRAALDLFALEHLATLVARCAEVAEATTTVVGDITANLGDTLTAPRDATPEDASTGVPDSDDTAPDFPQDAATDPGQMTDVDTDSGVEDDTEQALEPDQEASLPQGPLPPGTSNRVVFAEELGAVRAGMRGYRFRLATSPIELPEEAAWRAFLTTFSRTFYVSATLRVAGRWQFLRTRLGLPAGIATLELPTPFDLARQAELVCLADFPSWAEQSDGAMRTVAHQLVGYSREVVRPVNPDVTDAPIHGGFEGGALVLTTARSSAGGIANYLASGLRQAGDPTPVLSALVSGNARVMTQFTDQATGGGIVVGTRGLWQGVDVADETRLRLVWINKLPFAPFAAPVVAARREAVRWRAESAHAEDPDAVATEGYYLPLAALALRQAVGRLIRSERHRGVIVISDRKLAGHTALRRSYRRAFLGSLDPGLLRPDPLTGEAGGGNVVDMAEAWERIWAFLAIAGLVDPDRARELSTPEALDQHTLLPHTRAIRGLAMSPTEVSEHRRAGTLTAEVVDRSAMIGGLLRLSDTPANLKSAQVAVISAVAQGRDVLALLPTGFGKSFCFQLPALALPGVTLVISPLVALMADQALELNRTIGGAVRALVAPMRESSSRAGKTEVADQLLGRADHGIRMVYVSPERLAQRRFRELVSAAVAAGTVRRIVIDEAHTFVQWDDFRPSMTRAGQFLAQLRRDYELPITALTATANRTVLAGLRESVFGLPPDASAAIEADEMAQGSLVTIRENPIRPELAIFRRTMLTSSPAQVAALAEEVLDAVEDHAIFYCLTVREVVALHAHLRDYLGEGGARVRRFHGRLTEVEKSAVMNEFREAPRRGEDGFTPLIVVATSAFGLGINRPDVRTVFCVSTPTDVAALYQQIGRAGRDAASSASPAEPGKGLPAPEPVALPRPANVGLALLTKRGLRTAAFMTGSDLRPDLLDTMARTVLQSGPVLDVVRTADILIGAEVAAGRLTPDEASESRTAEEYQAGFVRAFAALAALGAVSDLGDFPPYATVKAGDLWGTTGDVDPIEVAVVSTLLGLPGQLAPTARGQLNRRRLDVHRAHKVLSAVDGYSSLATDVAGTWHLLADLHDRGLLDVSAAPSRRLVTALDQHTTTLPPGFGAAVRGKAARAAREIAALSDFFTDSTTCANVKLAEYFGAGELPPGCCTDATNMCSACWNAPGADHLVGQVKPPAAEALETPPRQAGSHLDRSLVARRLDRRIELLVWNVFRGVSVWDLYRALRGEDSYYHPVRRKRFRLRPALVENRYFGSSPSVSRTDIEDALERLEAAGTVTREGALWTDTGNIARRAAQQARAAAQVGT